MKTYLSNIIPQLQQYSQKLDNSSQLTNKHWVVIDEESNIKTVYIFRLNNELLISSNGKVTKGKWEYVGNNSLLIDIGKESYLFKQGFYDETFIALKIDNANEFAFLVNEKNYSNNVASIKQVESFLQQKYIPKPEAQKKLNPTTSMLPLQSATFKPPVQENLTKEATLIEREKFEKSYRTDAILQRLFFAFMSLCAFVLCGFIIFIMRPSSMSHLSIDFFIAGFFALLFAVMGGIFVVCAFRQRL